MSKYKIEAFLPTGIIFCSLLLASIWVFFVPIFQSPDEDTHTDYVFSLYSRKRPFRCTELPLSACSHPYNHLLFDATNGQAIKCTNFTKPPENYGTKQFYEAIDSRMPPANICAHTTTNPALVVIYPIGYYALTATWLCFLSLFNNSLTFLFFSARYLSVILLGLTLTFSYLIMRELRLSNLQSSLILMTIGFFPLTSFVSSYIQPDNLSIVASSVCFFIALRWRNISLKKQSIDCNLFAPYLASAKIKYANFLLLGLVMAILFLTKYQFYCCVGGAILAMILTTLLRLKVSFAELKAVSISLFAPSVIAGVLQTWIAWHGQLPPMDDKHWHWFPVDTAFRQAYQQGFLTLITLIWNTLQVAYSHIYCMNGQVFKSFWGCFGQGLSVPLIIGSPVINDGLRIIIEVITKMTIVFTLISLVTVLWSLLQLVRKGHWRSALYIACSNPVVNSYFLFVIFMFLFYVGFYPSYIGQGRQWFALIFPLIISATCFAPRIFSSPRLRKLAFYFITGAWLCYSLMGSYSAFGCIYNKYYSKDVASVINIRQLKPAFTDIQPSVTLLDYLDRSPTFNIHPWNDMHTLFVPAGEDIWIQGWVIDKKANSLASAVFLFIDNNIIYRAAYGLESKKAVEQLHNDKYRFSGFGAIFTSKGLAPGNHSLSIKFVSADGQVLYSTNKEIKIVIE